MLRHDQETDLSGVDVINRCHRILPLQMSSEVAVMLVICDVHVCWKLCSVAPLLTWMGFNPSVDKYVYYMTGEVWDEITYPFSNVNGTTVEV